MAFHDNGPSIGFLLSDPWNPIPWGLHHNFLPKWLWQKQIYPSTRGSPTLIYQFQLAVSTSKWDWDYHKKQILNRFQDHPHRHHGLMKTIKLQKPQAHGWTVYLMTVKPFWRMQILLSISLRLISFMLVCFWTKREWYVMFVSQSL